MKMYLYIMEYSTSLIYVKDITDAEDDDIERYLKSLGFEDINDVAYMYSENKIEDIIDIDQ